MNERTCSCCRETDSSTTMMTEIRETDSRISIKNRLDHLMARCGIRRMSHRVTPGLYRVGTPGPGDDLFVSANYTLSFDSLRRNLQGRNSWILVLDTGGVNVWCAAGKGSFGTRELIEKIHATSLKQKLSHRRLILPQLSGPGVAAHEVRRLTGFNVIYGPIRSVDIPEFLKNSRRATLSMRRIHFSLSDRLVLIPVDLIHFLKFLPLIFLILVAFNFPSGNNPVQEALSETLIFLGGILTGGIVFPLLLPLLPFRSFALNGFLLGFLYTGSTVLFSSSPLPEVLFRILTLPPLTAYIALNFTGSTPYTSLSGVAREVRIFVPIMLGMTVVGVIFRIWGMVR